MQLSTTSWGDGPRTALLLHGITSNAAGWWRLGPAIAERGYSVVAADLRGHGESPDDPDHRLAAHTADVLELGDHWDVVLGHSMGGLVATVTAAANPDWAGRLILEDPALYFPDVTAVIGWLQMDFDKEMTAERLAGENPLWASEDATAKAEALRQCGPEVVEQFFTQNQPFDYRREALALTVPTTLIGAEPPRAVVPTWLGEELAANPAVTFVQVMGSHSMHRDVWDDFWQVVSALV